MAYIPKVTVWPMERCLHLKTPGSIQRRLLLSGLTTSRRPGNDQSRSYGCDLTFDTCGKEGVQAVEKLFGETIPKDQVVPSTMVTIENVDAVEPIF